MYYNNYYSMDYFQNMSNGVFVRAMTRVNRGHIAQIHTLTPLHRLF